MKKRGGRGREGGVWGVLFGIDFLIYCCNNNKTNKQKKQKKKGEKDDPDALFQKYLENKKGKTKHCPVCKILSEKLDGCNHMSCASCKAEVRGRGEGKREGVKGRRGKRERSLSI